MDSRGVRLFEEYTIVETDEAGPVPEPAPVAPGTSNSSHVFSTPQSQASSQGAGDEEGRDLSKVGLFVVREVALVCGGVVGGGEDDGMTR